MAMLTGLLINRTLVTNNGGLIDRDSLNDHLLGQISPTSVYRGDCISLTWLEANFISPSRCNRPTGYVCSSIYITHGERLFFISTAGIVVPLYFLMVLDDFWAIMNYTWGEPCLYIYTGNYATYV